MAHVPGKFLDNCTALHWLPILGRLSARALGVASRWPA